MQMRIDSEMKPQARGGLALDKSKSTSFEMN